MFKSLREIATQLDFIRLGIRDLAHALKDWEAACTEESGESGGIVKAKNLKPGWAVDGKKIVAVSGVLRNQVHIYFGGDSAVLTLPSDALVLVDKEE